MASLGFATRPRLEKTKATLCMLRHGNGCCKVGRTQGRALTPRKSRCGADGLSHSASNRKHGRQNCGPLQRAAARFHCSLRGSTFDRMASWVPAVLLTAICVMSTQYHRQYNTPPPPAGSYECGSALPQSPAGHDSADFIISWSQPLALAYAISPFIKSTLSIVMALTLHLAPQREYVA